MSNALSALVLALAAVLQSEPTEERLYGRVLTSDGERLEGWLRWDRNETHVFDVLDGMKPILMAHDQEAEALDEELRIRRQRERSFSLPDLIITWDEDDEPRTTQAGIRFGHIRALQVVDERHVLVLLASGEEVELGASSSDIGRSFRGLVVETATRGDVELRWRDLDRIELMPAPASVARPSSERLHGTLRSQEGVELTGWVGWDLDEALATDILDGNVAGRRRTIVFGDIAALRRETLASTRVTLRSGEEMVLRGTNDVNADNRGIEISDASFGRAVVPWTAFESLRFHPPEPRAVDPDGGQDRRAGPGAHDRSAFDGGRPLMGTVLTRRGDRISGRVRWGNDEEYTWELLDGMSDGIDYDLELGLVHTIERVESGLVRVTLRDGRALELGGTDDVGEENGGIFVKPEGEGTVLVRWQDFVRLTLEP